MVNFIIWIIAGAVVGGLATLIIRRRRSILLLNIIMGIVSAFVAGYLLPPMFHVNRSSLPGMLVSLGGTIVLLMVVNFFVREHTVTNTVIKSQWNQVRDKIHVRWGKISEEDCDQINGNHERFINMLEERYGIAKEKAEDQLQRYLRAVTTKVPWLSFLHNPAHGHKTD
jgi:uncharacterized membrane protein YeaQ/YmgE (transglycosylase-associated protein family)/uncharacterized protein YjbJ (UPF0337 family)